MSVSKQRPDLQKSLVGFVVGEVTYAVSIGSVREIVNPVPLTELPHAPPTVAGVMDHRGEVVPVVDLRVRFGLPPINDPRRAKWLLIEVEGRSIGLAVDRVTDVFGTGGAEVLPAPALGRGDEERGITGVTKHDGALVFVLDVAAFDVLTEPLRPSLMAAAEMREAR
ncbi:MAG TPA: chemotaxis protein CheW [Polyangiaceae bacterium]|nr:chemotaxis protein CheW [Polyangiaceae bacterium]